MEPRVLVPEPAEGVQLLFPLFSGLEYDAESVNRAYISVPPCLREKTGE
jgi:hypothetical protein